MDCVHPKGSTCSLGSLPTQVTSGKASKPWHAPDWEETQPAKGTPGRSSKTIY